MAGAINGLKLPRDSQAPRKRLLRVGDNSFWRHGATQLDFLRGKQKALEGM
jgi:hypothetical protein